jgi:hypothetical protein
MCDIPSVVAGRPPRLRPDRHREDGGLRAARAPAHRRHRRATPPPSARWCSPPPASSPRRLARASPPTASTWLCAHGDLRRRGQNPQIAELEAGVDVLVATPGRLLDLAARATSASRPGRDLRARRGRPHAGHGLHPDVKRRVIARAAQKRQTLFFSATMPPDIRELASDAGRTRCSVEVTPIRRPSWSTQQRVFRAPGDKRACSWTC